MVHSIGGQVVKHYLNYTSWTADISLFGMSIAGKRLDR